MNRIDAFVAHSFVVEDAALVGAFLKYFDQLSGLHPNFKWESAEAAEPKVLADKVKAIVADKNVLIAICTKKERVVPADRLSPLLFRPEYVKGRSADFEWHTSDWIIQEIGLAIGKGLQLILLIEDGVRQPGGLQGDLEYIPFERTAPEKCFGKIVEMLKALSPKAAVEDGAAAAPPPAESSGVTDKKGDDGDESQAPKPGWRRNDYEYAAFSLIAADDEKALETISAAYASTEAGAQLGATASWEAYCEWIRIYLSKGNRLPQLKTLAADNPTNFDVWMYLGNAYLQYEQHEPAASCFETAFGLVSELRLKMNALRRAATARHKAGQPEAAHALLEQMKAIDDQSEAAEKAVLTAERSIAEIAKDDLVLIGVLERLADLDPADTDLRFSLAYKHSVVDGEDLALFHYRLVPDSEKTAMAWNNLGVAYDDLELPAKSVVAYRRSESMGETLAMSNIANRLSRAGFLDEAQNVCQKALAASDFHKNVPNSVVRIKEIPDEEAQKEKELLERAARLSDFYKKFGHSLSRRMLQSLPSAWTGPECVLNVQIVGNGLLAVGNYERPNNTLLSLSYLPLSDPNGPPLKFRIEFQGLIRGRAVLGTVTRRLIGDKPRTILGAEEAPKVLMALSDDGTEIRVCERLKKNAPTFYNLTLLP